MKAAVDKYSRFVTAVNIIYKWAAVALLAAISVALFLQIITRYVFNSSLLGSEEFALYAFIWMSMLGGSLAVGNSSHSVVSILNDALPEKGKEIHNFVVDLIILAFAMLLIIKGIEMAIVSAGQITPAIHLPKPAVYASLVVSGVGIVLNSIRNLLTHRQCGEEVES